MPLTIRAIFAALLLTTAASAQTTEHQPAPVQAEETALVAAAAARAAPSPVLAAINDVLRSSGGDRRAKLEALCQLGDAEAVPLLAYVARRDNDLDTRVTATRLIGRFTTPEAGSRADQLLLDARENVSVRIAATEAYADTGQASAGPALMKVSHDTDAPEELRRVALNTLRSRFPELAAEAERTKVATSPGRSLAMITGALSGSYTLALVGALSPNSSAATVTGAIGGLVIGGTGAALLAKSYPITQGDALFLMSAGAWSVPVGTMLGSLTGGPSASCESPSCPAIMLATHVAAMGSAWAARSSLAMTPRDVIELNVTTLSALLLTMGLVAQGDPTGEDRLPLGLFALGGTAGFIGGSLLAPRVDVRDTDFAATALLAADLAYTGSLLGTALVSDTAEGPLGSVVPNDRKSAKVTGFMLAGAGLGAASMLATSHFWKPSSSDLGLFAASTINGHLLGAGLGMLSKTDDHLAPLGAAIGGLAAGAGSIALTRMMGLELKHGDGLLLFGGELFVAAQAYGWASYLDLKKVLGAGNLPDGATVGTLATGLGGFGVIALSQLLDEPAWNLGWIFAGGVWGAWIAGWSAYAMDASSDNGLLAILLGSDLGLAAAATLTSPLVGLSPTTLAWMSVGGVAGMTLGTMATVFASNLSGSGHPVAVGNVVGTVVGLGAGVVLAKALEDRGGGSGSDAPVSSEGSLLDHMGVPMPSVGPMTDANGRLVPGMQAQVVWSL